MNKLLDAAQALKEAIRLQPNFMGAHTTLAAVLRAQGDNLGADRENRTAETLSREKTNLQGARFATNSGKRLLTAGDLPGAISQFRNAIRMVPDYAPAHYQLAIALARSGQKDDASAEFHKAGDLDPHLKTPAP